MESEKKVIFNLNNSLYTKKAIEKALLDFHNVCKGKIINNNFNIELSPKQNLDKPLKEEFCNYVLALMKNID